MISNVTENVRIRREGSPFEVTSDVIVEVLRDGAWEYYRGFNSLSDDYAFTNAREAAKRAVKTLAIPA
jgi:predicted Zn-dependent protease